MKPLRHRSRTYSNDPRSKGKAERFKTFEMIEILACSPPNCKDPLRTAQRPGGFFSNLGCSLNPWIRLHLPYNSRYRQNRPINSCMMSSAKTFAVPIENTRVSSQTPSMIAEIKLKRYRIVLSCLECHCICTRRSRKDVLRRFALVGEQYHLFSTGRQDSVP